MGCPTFRQECCKRSWLFIGKTLIASGHRIAFWVKQMITMAKPYEGFTATFLLGLWNFKKYRRGLMPYNQCASFNMELNADLLKRFNDLG